PTLLLLGSELEIQSEAGYSESYFGLLFRRQEPIFDSLIEILPNDSISHFLLACIGGSSIDPEALLEFAERPLVIDGETTVLEPFRHFSPENLLFDVLSDT